MRKVRIQARAEKDLLGIWDYSFVEWGPSVADQYLDILDEAIRALADSPQAGASRGYIREGCRVLFVKRHAVYYTVTSSAVQIIRVLHGQMDPEKHL